MFIQTVQISILAVRQIVEIMTIFGEFNKNNKKEKIMFGKKFLGKTHIPHRKNTEEMTPVVMTPPCEVILPVKQHIGTPATPVVKVGDEVKVGQLVAEATGYVSSPVYASVSGKVSKIDTCLPANGESVIAIRIESDGLMTVSENIAPPDITDVDSLVEAIRASGIVGLGGAGFPTAVKFDAVKKGGIHTLVINGAECEPYITVDSRTMIDDAEYIAEAISLFKRVMPDIKSYVFGIEENKPLCIEKIKSVFKDDSSVSVCKLPSLYPQGSEKVLIRNTTGLVVPEGKLPGDVGVIVINVTTLAAISKYIKTGMPLVSKTLTLDGSAIKNPMNVTVPIGTPIGHVIDFAGGFKCEAGKIIFGGPMTGSAAYSLDEPVVKTTGAIIALAKKDSLHPCSTACIHCGRCVDACPHRLSPSEFGAAMRLDNVDERMAALEKSRIMLCVECGCCAYVCPAKRPMIENIRLAKNALQEYKANKATLK